ncbi:MAG: hypothetical protein QOC71_220 [Thermoplasmata archaeon]|nr:hypothetical protein [Thermoplasmata archaeon]
MESVALLRTLVPLLAVAVLASGCLSDLSAVSSSAGNADPEQAAAPSGAHAGTAATHAAPQRTEGPVSARQEGGQWVANRTIRIANDFGGAPRSHDVLSTFNGAISLQPSTDGGYRFEAELNGRGNSETEARQALDLLELQNTDDLRGDTLELSFALTANTPAMLPIPVVLANGVNNGAAYRLWLPSEPAHDVEAGTSNGAIAAVGLHGPHYKAGTSNGAVSANGAFDRVEAKTTNGAVSLGGGAFNDVDAETSNGAIAVALDPTRSATAKLTTSNGAIAVEVPRDDGTAFDITADTTNGRIVIDVEDHDSVSDDHEAYRSPGWSSADFQLTLDLQTTNGSIIVED